MLDLGPKYVIYNQSTLFLNDKHKTNNTFYWFMHFIEIYDFLWWISFIFVKEMAKIAKNREIAQNAHSGPSCHREILSKIIFMPRIVIHRPFGSRWRAHSIAFRFFSLVELYYHSCSYHHPSNTHTLQLLPPPPPLTAPPHPMAITTFQSTFPTLKHSHLLVK